MNSLRIEDLSKRYGKVLALDRVSLFVEPGVFGLLGPNGAGKTTLMNILATLLPRDGGTLSMGDLDWSKPDRVRRILGYLPQHFGMYRQVTVREILAHIGTLKNIEHKMLPSEITRVLAATHMERYADYPIRALSGGMLRRVGVAQAILGDPKLLIVDEPTAGLDPEERVSLRNLLSTLAKDRIVILSTHIVQDLESIAASVAILNLGKVLACEPPEDLVGKAAGYVREAVIPSDEYDRLVLGRTVISFQIRADGVHCRYLGETILGDHEAEPTLEDAYILMTGRKEAYA